MFRTATILLLCFLVPAISSAEEVRVRSGQSLARIAARHHVSVHDLAAANHLARDASLQEGQVLTLPETGLHYVRSGESLSAIARSRSTTVRELMRLNRLRSENVREGQALRLPGFEARTSERSQAVERGWGRPSHPGRVTLYRITTRERLRLKLLDSRGRPRRAARRQLERLLRPRDSRRTKAPAARLLTLLTQVSDHFGGRTIQVVSGYRIAGGRTRETSHHTDGSAIDFRVDGVPVTAVRDYVKRFANVGVGYYPTSHFVHLDVRRQNAYWVDRSGPGQRAQYVRRRGADVESTESSEDLTAEDVRQVRSGEQPVLDTDESSSEGSATENE